MQQKDEIIVTFAEGFHMGFTASKFSIAEAVNCSSHDWILNKMLEAKVCRCGKGANDLDEAAGRKIAYLLGIQVKNILLIYVHKTIKFICLIKMPQIPQILQISSLPLAKKDSHC
jgi:hypothetical protein